MGYEAESDKYVRSWADAFELPADAARVGQPASGVVLHRGGSAMRRRFVSAVGARVRHNNLRTAGMCHEASGRALTASFTKGTCDRRWEKAARW
jgi:hypothetical protein